MGRQRWRRWWRGGRLIAVVAECDHDGVAGHAEGVEPVGESRGVKKGVKTDANRVNTGVNTIEGASRLSRTTPML